MSKLKRQLEEMEKQQKKYRKLILMQQSTCPHVSKKGKSRLESFVEDGVRKARCKKCNAIVIVDDELLGKDSVKMSTEVMRAILSELRARNHTGQLKLGDNILKLITDFDAGVLTELPEFMDTISKGGLEAGKKKKKGKKKDKKKNKRSRWN